MRILFNNGTPRPVAVSLKEHQATRALQIGWHELENGALLQKAEAAGFDLLLKTDKNIAISRTLQAGRSPSWYLATNSVRMCVRTSIALSSL